jgi:FkbM family methyltransferase
MDAELRLRTRNGPVLTARLRDLGGPTDVFGMGEYGFATVDWPDVRFVIDLGAHIGSFTVWAVTNYHCRALAVEPNPETFALLGRNVDRFGGDVRCVQAAVARASGTRSLTLGEDSAGNALASEPATTPTRSVEVVAITLREAIEMAGFPSIDILKMDIEGAEHEILTNLHPGLLDGVRSVLVECHRVPGRSSEAIVQALAREGFSISLRRKSEDLDLVLAHRRVDLPGGAMEGAL